MPLANLVHYVSVATTLKQLRSEIDMLLSADVKVIRINPNLLNANEECIAILNYFQKEGGQVIIESDLSFAIKCRAVGLHIRHLEEIEPIRKQNPTWLIGASARTIAECKNWELENIDYIEVKINETKVNNEPVNGILSSALMEDLIPVDEAYGWKVLSINTPILGSGFVDFDTIKNAKARYNFKGVVISHLLRSSARKLELVKDINSLFN